jgi:hypothetical protein
MGTWRRISEEGCGMEKGCSFNAGYAISGSAKCTSELNDDYPSLTADHQTS